MKLKIRTLRNAELYKKQYERFADEPEVYSRPQADIVELPHNIADALIVGYKVFKDEDDVTVIGIYTTLEDMSFITAVYSDELIEKLDQIIEDHNFIFIEPQLRYEAEVQE
jgi:hypothetical protein